jgi:predicted nucleic acid-binding protein
MAKEKGVVENVGKIIEVMRYQGYWLSDDLINIARKLAKEI